MSRGHKRVKADKRVRQFLDETRKIYSPSL